MPLSPRPADQPSTILVVDDTPDNLAIIGGLLRPHYRVRVASSGARALQAVRTAPRPDLILLDVMMPDMDGHAVIGQLKADPLTADIPVIFVTAMDADTDEEHGLELGAADYITKPVRPAVLLARVRSHLELKRSRDWLRDQNGFLEAEVARRIHENELIKDVSLHALALLAETRDPETGNHLHRTRAYVEALTRHLARQPRYAAELTPQRCSMIAKAAPLHDIGKVGVPDDILHKPGKLSADEYEIMKRHASIGAAAIESALLRVQTDPSFADADALPADALYFLDMARQIALSHHERWDGRGYPEGLAGEAIPLPARLMALADVFDALSCRRVYKPPFDMSEVDRIIREGRGSHFDPAVVDAYFELRPTFIAIAARYLDGTATSPAPLTP